MSAEGGLGFTLLSCSDSRQLSTQRSYALRAFERNLIGVLSPPQERLVFHCLQLSRQQFGKLFGYFQLPFYIFRVHLRMIFSNPPNFKMGSIYEDNY